MDLTSPLRSLIPSLESAVLETLAGTESALSASRIARLAPRGSRQGLTLALDRLVEQGLVIADPANHGYAYRLNRRHVLVESVFVALAATTSLVDHITEAVGGLDPAPMHAALFGSVTRADGDESSDIDLFLLVAPGLDHRDDGWRQQVRQLEDDVLAWTGNRLEPLILTFDDLGQALRDHEPIIESLLVESLRLHGPPLTEVVAMAADGGRGRSPA